MTPVDYENLVNQILDGGLDLDELTKQVEAEQERRAKKDEADAARENAIEALLEYFSTVTGDDSFATEEFKETITEDLKKLEEQFIKQHELVKKFAKFGFVPPIQQPTKETAVDFDEDAVRTWLKNKRRKDIPDIPF